MHALPHPSVRTALIASIWLSLCALSAVRAGDAGGGGPAGKSKAVTVEAIPGSAVKRVILTAKAAERLGIETGKVTQDQITRKQVVSGMVVYPQQQPGLPPVGTTVAAVAPKGTSFASFGGGFNSPIVMAPPAAGIKDASLKSTGALVINAAGQSEVVVTLSPTEYERIDKTKPARITPLYTRDKGVTAMTALLSDAPPVEDARRAMLTLHYLLPNSAHGLPPSTRMRVELQMADSSDPRRLVPYRSVFYDAKGASWVFVNTKPLTYERQPIKIEHIVGDMAVLSDGPPLDTPIVTVGASLLYGSEVFGK